MLNTFDGDTRVRMEQAIDEVGQGLGDQGDQFRAALVELAPFLNAARRLTHETAIRRTQTKRLVHNLTLMMGELGRRDDDLHKIVVGGAHTFSELAAQDASLADVLAQFPPTLQQLLPTFATLRKTADELDPAFDALQPAARSLPGALANLRDFSLEARPSLAALRRPVPELTDLVDALRPTADGLDRAFTRLQPQAPRLDSITAKVVPCEYAVQKFFANTISLMKFADARGLVPRGQTVDGNSLFQREGKSCAPGGAAQVSRAQRFNALKLGLFLLVCFLVAQYYFSVAGTSLIPKSDPYHVQAVIPTGVSLATAGRRERGGRRHRPGPQARPARQRDGPRHRARRRPRPRLSRRPRADPGEERRRRELRRALARARRRPAPCPAAACSRSSTPARRPRSTSCSRSSTTRASATSSGSSTARGTALRKGGGDLNRTVEALSSLSIEGSPASKVLGKEREHVARLVDSFGRVTGALGARGDSIRLLTRQAKATAEAVADRDTQLRATLDQLPALPAPGARPRATA